MVRSQLIVLSLAVAAPALSQPAPADAPAVTPPATQPVYPALEQLNAECVTLYKQMQGNMLRVQMPAPRWTTDAEARLQRYNLNSDVNRALQQARDRAARGNTYDYNQQRSEPETAPQQPQSAPAGNVQGNGQGQPNRPSNQTPAQRPAEQRPAGPQPTDQQVREELTNNGKQGYTIIVPAPQAEQQQQFIGNNAMMGNGAPIANDGQAFLANSLGLLLNDQGHLLVPAYLDRDSAAEQPIRLARPDGQVIRADYVGSDQQTQLTVLKLNLPQHARGEKAGADNIVPPAKNAVPPAGDAKDADPAANLGQPVKLADKPLTEGTLVMMVSPVDGSARLSVWNGGVRDSGVVVTIDGKVAGIARHGQFLSASACRLIADQIMRHGVVRRATLGVIITQVEANDPARQAAALGDRPAVRVDQVMKDSVAEKGGLQKGDLILSLAGEPVHDIPSLATAIAKRQGVTPLKVLRGEQVLTVEVDLVIK